MIAGGVGEEVDLFLGNHSIVRVTEVGADECSEIFDAVHVRGHVHLQINFTFTLAQQAFAYLGGMLPA